MIGMHAEAHRWVGVGTCTQTHKLVRGIDVQSLMEARGSSPGSPRLTQGPTVDHTDMQTDRWTHVLAVLLPQISLSLLAALCPCLSSDASFPTWILSPPRSLTPGIPLSLHISVDVYAPLHFPPPGLLSLGIFISTFLFSHP